ETLRDFGVYVFKDLYNDDYDNPTVGVSTHHQMRKVKNLLAFDKISNSTVNYEPVSVVWISDILLMLSRSQKDEIVFAAHGGHNAESHNHNDVGDFIIYKDGKPLLVDAGRGNYTARTFSSERYTLWFTQSEYHNLPIINGVGQRNGREFEAKNVDYKKSDQNINFTLDIAKSYPEEAMVNSWKRNLNFDKNKAIITVSDSYSLGTATSLEHVFMSVANVDISEKGKIKLTEGDANLTINYDAKTWNISTGFPSTEGMEYKSFKTKWDGKQVQRIVLKHTTPKKDGTHNFKITF
ncbi:MAG: heparinase II/III family protein, partial [Spirosomataceae bacterium]